MSISAASSRRRRWAPRSSCSRSIAAWTNRARRRRWRRSCSTICAKWGLIEDGPP